MIGGDKLIAKLFSQNIFNGLLIIILIIISCLVIGIIIQFVIRLIVDKKIMIYER